LARHAVSAMTKEWQSAYVSCHWYDQESWCYLSQCSHIRCRSNCKHRDTHTHT